MVFEKFDEVDWIADEAAEFASYWRGLSRPGILPHQSQFDPAAIPHLLPGIAIYELRGESEIICRLMGTGLVDYFGHDSTDKNILKWWAFDQRDAMESGLRQMAAEPCGTLVRIGGLTESNAKVSGVSVGFPALDSDGKARRLLFYTSMLAAGSNRNSREDKVVNFETDEIRMIALV